MTLTKQNKPCGKKTPENGFNKQSRIRKTQEYKRLSQTGKKLSNRYFITVYAKGSTDQTRLGITVSKKVGNAVVRNRVKRAIRECFRTYDTRKEMSVDINVIAKPYAKTLSPIELKNQLKPLFNYIAKKNV